MSDWRPTSPPAAARRRALLLERARGYFAQHDVLAVDTPAISRHSGSDPNIDSIALRFGNGSEAFLHTSPELPMKRLLAAGYPDIFSICRVFRDGEAGARHQPEFTLIEWYRKGFGLDAIIDDTAALIACCLERPELGETLAVEDYAAAFRNYAEIDVFADSAECLADRVGADRALRAALGDDRDAWLDLLLDQLLAPHFAGDRLTVLRHFPASKAALARLCPDDDRLADRFEVFMGTLELANGYVELADAGEQRQRMLAESVRRQAAGKAPVTPDPHLLAALTAGLPACAGVAVGAERLQMLLDKTDNIADVVTFTFGQAGG